jgi:hypothetical protein
MDSIVRRKAQGRIPNVPSAIKGERIFLPDTGQTRTVDATSVNDIVRSGQVQDIEIPYNAPGIFVARALTVNIACSQVVTDNSQTQYTLWHPVAPTGDGETTVNVSPYTTGTTLPLLGGPCIPFSFLWGLSDPRSGKRFSSDLMSCVALLPPLANDMPGNVFKFDAPWVLERDSQLNFAFLPLNDLVQTATAGRNQQVRVRVEVHGTRYFTEQDALRKGAQIP